MVFITSERSENQSFRSGLKQIIVYVNAEHTRLNVWLLNSDLTHPSTNSFQDVQWGRGFKIADRRAASSSRALR